GGSSRVRWSTARVRPPRGSRPGPRPRSVRRSARRAVCRHPRAPPPSVGRLVTREVNHWTAGGANDCQGFRSVLGRRARWSGTLRGALRVCTRTLAVRWRIGPLRQRTARVGVGGEDVDVRVRDLEAGDEVAGTYAPNPWRTALPRAAARAQILRRRRRW